MSSRRVLVIAHTGRAATLTALTEVVSLLNAAEIGVVMLPSELDSWGGGEGQNVTAAAVIDDPAADCELVIVLGGDGTILRGAELVRGTAVPLLGINLGRVGFLAEGERDGIADAVARIAAKDYSIDERMTLDVDVYVDQERVAQAWALNEASIEKVARESMIEVVIEINGRPVTEFGCDGVVLSTPTGSTAYAFSVGGPVMWPDVEALLVAPISAHALFARPMVVSPTAVPSVELLPGRDAVLWCDGRRSVPVPGGSRVEVRRSPFPVRLARMAHEEFADRLVAKFALPVHGWRGSHVPEDLSETSEVRGPQHGDAKDNRQS